MKLILTLCISTFLFFSVSAQCLPQIAEFAEVNFVQDSINPLVIHLTARVKSGIHCDVNQTGDTIGVNWGDGGWGEGLPMVDTFIIDDNASSPYIIYQGSHTYDSLPSDSAVSIVFGVLGRAPHCANCYMDPATEGLAVIASLNFKYLAHCLGYISPFFKGPLYTIDTLYQPFTFDPQLEYGSATHVMANLITPIQNPGVDADIDFPPQGRNNGTITIVYNSGFLSWDTPTQYNIGGYDILFQVDAYNYNMHVCSIMRDMRLYIVRPANLGVDNVLSYAHSVKCYPSPSTGNFTIDMTDFDKGIKDIKIFDQLGQSVFQTISSLDKIQVAEMLSPGLYTISVTSHTSTANTRILID